MRPRDVLLLNANLSLFWLGVCKQWAEKFNDMYTQSAHPEPECNLENFYCGGTNPDIYCRVPGLEEPYERWNETLKDYASLAAVIQRSDPGYCDYLFD